MSSNLSSLKLKGLLTQTPPLEFFAHCFQPRDLVLVKSWKDDGLQPSWEGPYQVLLIMETAVRMAEKVGLITPKKLTGGAGDKTELASVPGG